MLDVDVLIVGGGPTGLAAANILGTRGIRVLLVEQDAGVALLPRAVSVDDEAMRLMQSIGLLEETRHVVVPGTGTKYYGARGQLLAYARGPARPPFGHAVKNPMDHSEFQQVLLDGARRFSSVELRHRTEFVAMDQDDSGVTATIRTDGAQDVVRARYLFGADGGRSLVRTAIGQEPMSGSAFAQRWLVVDTVGDLHDARYAMHHGDPDRPRVVIVGRGGRCRYEFLVHPDEQPGEDELLDFAIGLVAPFRVLEKADVVRCTIYHFYALVADRFSLGRAFILGDAAHMMPPFAGQGLNSGLRDAANLSWKVAAVIAGQAGPPLLDTYTQERKPHVEATVRLSVRMGAVMMTCSSARARLRDASIATLGRLPRIRRLLREMRFRPAASCAPGFCVRPVKDGVVGHLLVQPDVLSTAGQAVKLDDVLGPGFCLLAVDVGPKLVEALRSPLWEQLEAGRVALTLDDRLPTSWNGAVAVADLDGALEQQLAEERGRILLIRPDRFIAGSFAPGDEAAFSEQVRARLAAPLRVAVPAEAA